ncbi:hypothetical protein [Longimicrobium sp.]|uniref:hypothetical protein n=1 Tax=Longimicrobium sp. TaxID=2029185 RepID=UPI003B3B6F66
MLDRHTMPDETANPAAAPADAIRRALIDAAEAAYEDAGIQGLCAEGRWEAAVSAMRRVDVEAVARGALQPSTSNEFTSSSDRSAPPESAASA